MIINSSGHLYGDEGFYVNLPLEARSVDRASLGLAVVYPTVLPLAARTTDRAVLSLQVTMPTNLPLAARTIERASLGLQVIMPTELEMIARTIERANLTLSNEGGHLPLVAREVARASLGLRILRQPMDELVLTIRIVPSTRVRRHKDLAKFSVNNVEMPISDYSADFPENSAGCVVSVTLAKFADRSLIVPGAVYKFELFKKLAGVWTPRVLIDTGTFQGSSLTVGFGDRKRADVFTLSTFEPLANKLGKSPLQDLTVYDPFRVATDELNTEIEYDTEGVAFVSELKPIPNLTVHKLFDEIFIQRCGFTEWKTNIPDTPVKEVQITTEQTFMDAVAPTIGSFVPDFTVVGDVLWIRDTTDILPAGFPLPVALTVDDYATVGISNSEKELDCYQLVYFEDKEDYDYFTPFVETLPEEMSGTPGAADYSQTKTTRTERRYFKSSNPTVPVKIDLYEEERETRNNVEVTGRATETFYYDYQGRVYRSTKVFKSLVPAFDDGDGFLKILETVREETTTITYGRHPFEPSKQVILRKQTITKGQIAVDTVNEYEGEPFRQPMIVANRSGNITESSTAEYGPIEKITETIQILPGDQIRTVTIKEDLVSGNTEYDYSDVSYGDASSAQKGRQRKVYVFENPGDVFTGKGKETLPVGELPLEYAIPLARRKLKKRKLGGDGVDASLNGLELFLDRGNGYTVFDADEGELGVFTVKGFRFAGRSLGTRSVAHTTTFRGQRVK